MKQQQSGFTLIELVMVIVILGILAATALPKFVNLSADARDAALIGVAGAISSGNVINVGVRALHPASGVIVAGCAAGASLLQGGLPGAPDYTIPTNTTAASGVTVTCYLVPNTVGNAASAVFTVTGA